MTPAETTGKTAVFPGVVKVKASIVAALVMSYPMAIGMNVRGVGVTFMVLKVAVFILVRCSPAIAMIGLGTMFGCVPRVKIAVLFSAMMLIRLGERS